MVGSFPKKCFGRSLWQMLFETRCVFKTLSQRCLNILLKIKTRLGVTSLFMLQVERLLNMDGNTIETKRMHINQYYYSPQVVGCMLHVIFLFTCFLCSWKVSLHRGGGRGGTTFLVLVALGSIIIWVITVIDLVGDRRLILLWERMDF